MPPKAKAEEKITEDKTTETATAVEETTNTESNVDQIAHEVLTGVWGSYDGLRDRLSEAGHDASAVFTKVNQRLTRGAPSAYKPSALDLAEQVQNGEWGEEKGLKQRLAAAGFASPTAYSALKKQ